MRGGLDGGEAVAGICEKVSLKAEMEMNWTGLRCFCSAFQSTAAADWNDARPSMDLVLGVVSGMVERRPGVVCDGPQSLSYSIRVCCFYALFYTLYNLVHHYNPSHAPEWQNILYMAIVWPR